MSATTAETLGDFDTRPLKEKVKDALTDDNNRNFAASVAAGVAGGAFGASLGYLSYIVGYHFLQAIAMPAWYMTMTNVAGGIIITGYALWFAWMGFGMVRDRI